MWSIGVILCSLVLLTYRIVKFRAYLKAVSSVPGMRCAFSPLSLIGAILPTTFFNPGLNWQWEWRKSIYVRLRSQTISFVPFLVGIPTIHTISVDVAKQILSSDPRIFKSHSATRPISMWGDSLISANGQVYKRHRWIVGPAFGPVTYNLVTRETVRLYYDMLEAENWSQQELIVIESVNKYVSKFTLGVLTRCGFGLPFAWSATPEDNGDNVAFGEALQTVCDGTILRFMTPRWAYKLPIKRLHELDDAHHKLSSTMSSFIAAKKERLGSDLSAELTGSDLLSRLVAASEGEGNAQLDETELIGNIFAFLFAGHETSSHALVSTLAMLALYDDEQRAAFEQITAVLGTRDPTFEDYTRLYKVLACFQESTRLFPPGFMVMRDTAEPIVLKMAPEDGGGDVVLPAGVRLMVDMIGLHYNPRLFPDPELFRPSRWHGVAESDSSIFGLGPRACIGRKFALTEAVCFLALILRDWEIGVRLKEGETKAEWRERVLQGKMIGLSFGVPDVPIQLTRRKKRTD